MHICYAGYCTSPRAIVARQDLSLSYFSASASTKICVGRRINVLRGEELEVAKPLRNKPLPLANWFGEGRTAGCTVGVSGHFSLLACTISNPWRRVSISPPRRPSLFPLKYQNV